MKVWEKTVSAPKKERGGILVLDEIWKTHLWIQTIWIMSGGEGGMSEGIRMPKAPSDADKSMKGSSRERKERTLSNFKAAADDAKKRQKYKDENDDLAVDSYEEGCSFL